MTTNLLVDDQMSGKGLGSRLLNHADVAAIRARPWLTANAARVEPGALAAARLYLETREAEVARLRRRFTPLWRRVEGPGYRRALALTVATP